MRIGQGYDAHRLVDGRPLILGGVEVPFTKGLEGHSDADVLTHAVCDALLGAAALGDLGRHFPDSDPEYKGVSSMKLLRRVCELIQAQGWAVNNVDVTLVAQGPRIGPFREEMIANLARTLGVEPGRVNVKATTTEGMGFAGKGEGMAAMCVATIRRI
ncbi:MAG: 2-C-methyl-D-erythritol 2,4-cyclodiphosphate synthase [Desulfatibacillaceae bacterium]